jgi:carbonic anhydrase
MTSNSCAPLTRSPPKITVSGHVYDVDTGTLTTVVPTAPMLTT